MTRLLINEGIAQKAEEDLEKLLMSSSLDAISFNYSPFILRIVNEIILEKGSCLALGEKTEKGLIDNYWTNLDLEQETDILVRIVGDSKKDISWSIIILIKNNEIKEKVWEDLYRLKKLRPKNDRVFRGTFSKFKDDSRDSIIRQITDIFAKNSLTYKIEDFLLQKIIRKPSNNLFEFLIPLDIGFSCTSCNMCELPSSYSINPIPNVNDKPFQDMFTKLRIGFPSNLACLSLSEGLDISSETNQRIEEFCHPILFSKNKEGVIIDYQLALNQEQGLCVFHNKETGLCNIHDSKPLSCFSYPFLIHQQSDNHFSIELDFSCPGIERELSSSLELLLDEIQNRLLKKDLPSINFNDAYSLKWNLLDYFKDGERVYQEDIEEAVSLLTEKYAQYTMNS